MIDIDTQHWSVVPPTPPAGAARASISARGHQKVRITLNGQLIDRLGWGLPRGCQVFEGQGARLGWLLVRPWRGNEPAPYQLQDMLGGRYGRISLIRFEWAPDEPIAAEPVRFELVGDDALALELPAWFDRELFREAEAREARGR